MKITFDIFKKIFTNNRVKSINNCKHPINQSKFNDDNTENVPDIINQKISPYILSQVRKMQNQFQGLTNSDNIECCICMEEDRPMISLECWHPLCVMCYKKLIIQKYMTCPLCRKTMNKLIINKFYAIMVLVDITTIGILYLSPIFGEKNNYINHELIYDIYNKRKIQKFINCYARIQREKYVIITDNLDIKNLLDSINFSKINYIYLSYTKN